MLRIPGRHAAPLALCVLLAAAHTWPLALSPATLSLNWHADVLLNEWILAWIAHQLPRAPAELFDANIFYPARHTLALSEPLLVPAVVGAPLAWLGASPVLVHNLLLLLGYALTAAAGYVVVYRWTGDRAAALIAASALAFNTHTLARIAHLQAVHLYGLALAVYAADAVAASPTLARALRLGAWLTLLAYTSAYLAVFGLVAAAVVLAARLPAWRRHAAALIPRLLVAAAAAGVAILPLYVPYRWVAREYALQRTLEHVAQFSATPTGYLATAGRVHQFWSARFVADPGLNAFFAGGAVLLLAMAAASLAGRTDRPRVAMLGALAATGAVLSLGTGTPAYEWLYAALPPMQGLRVAARFGALYLLALALLAGIGLAAIRRRTARRRVSLAVAAVSLAVVNLEAAIAPVHYQRFEGVPRIYTLLAQETQPVVLVEVPVFPPDVIFENAPYVFASTAHWRKLVNGYSGFTPPAYRDLQPRFWHFPHPRSLQAMRDAGVTHVMVHPERMFAGGDELVAECERTTALERIAISPAGMRLYRLR